MRKRLSVKSDGNLNKITTNNCYLFRGEQVKITSPGTNLCIVKFVANGQRIEAGTRHLKSAPPN